MRNIRIICLLLLMLLALASCGGPEGQQNEEEQADGSSENLVDQEERQTGGVIPQKADKQLEDDGEADQEEEDSGELDAEEPIAAAVSAKTYTEYSEEAYDQVVAEVLGSIVTSDMTKLQQAKAIYTYTRGGIRYTGTSDKSDWKQGAYTGMTTKAGDCFTYYAVARALLTAAGIDNLEVQRVGGPTSHYWNLVNCGDGWYHFDATPRSSKLPAFDSFMFTDQEAADYTAKAGRSYYSFDGSLYPERAGGPAVTPAVSTGKPAAPAEDTASADVPEDTSPEEADPEEAGPEDIGSENAAPEETVLPVGGEDAPEAGEPWETELELPEETEPVDAAVPEEENPSALNSFDTEMPDWLTVSDTDDGSSSAAGSAVGPEESPNGMDN